MPLVDLPLESLLRYEGISSRPHDHDDYWHRALHELDRTDPNQAIQTADFKASFCSCEHLYFDGVRGGRIYAKKLSPLGKPQGAILMFHGYSVNSGDWSDKLKYVAAGWTVYAMDVRGQGGKSFDAGGHHGNTLHGHIIRGLDGPPDDLFYRQVFLDTAQLARIAEADGHARLVSVGASQGGALALICAALHPQISRVAAWYPFLSDYKRVWEMDLARGAYEELQQYFRRFDPRHQRAAEVWEKLGLIDVQWLTPRIRGAVRMFTGLMDTICPPSTQFAAYNRIISKKSVEIYPDFGHEGLPGAEDKTFAFLVQT